MLELKVLVPQFIPELATRVFLALLESSYTDKYYLKATKKNITLY